MRGVREVRPEQSECVRRTKDVPTVRGRHDDVAGLEDRRELRHRAAVLADGLSAPKHELQRQFHINEEDLLHGLQLVRA